MGETTAEGLPANSTQRDIAGLDGNGQRRMSMWLSTGRALALAWLTFHYGVTQRDFVEGMLPAESARKSSRVVFLALTAPYLKS